MIKNYNQFNESLLDKLEGPSREEIINNISINDFLYKSCVNSEYDDVKFALNNGADVHHLKDICIRFSNNYNIIKLLLEYGADIHISDDLPLYNATRRHDNKTCKLLIKNGANFYKSSILDYIIQKNMKVLLNFLIKNEYLKWDKMNSEQKRYAEIYLTEEQVEKIKNNY